MRRGELVAAVAPGEYGKPRPVLVIQADAFSELASVTVLPLTTDLRAASLVRIEVEPTRDNGLAKRSHIMIDKAVTISRAKIRQPIGQLDAAMMRHVGEALARFLAIR